MIEVGLGGRLDSTNVCSPVVSVITNIGMDHTHLLGDQLHLIAAEKAGIIKPGIPIVSGETNPAAADVIRRIAAERAAPLLAADRDFGARSHSMTQRIVENRSEQAPSNGSIVSKFDYWADHELIRRELPDVEVRVLGRHQHANAAVALTACHLLEDGVRDNRNRQNGERVIDENAMRKGLQTMRIRARIEVSPRDPRLIIDVAHNVPSMQAFIQTINEHFPTGHRTLVLSISRDKDLPGILACLPQNFDRVILTRYLGNPRATPPHELNELLEHQLQLQAPTRLAAHEISTTENPESASKLVQSMGVTDGWVFVAGSVFLAAEFSRCVQDWHHEPAI